MKDALIIAIGMLATMIGILSFMPVISVIYKSKRTNNFPYYTIFLAIISNILWFIYGIYKETYANILSGTLYFIIYCFILYIKLLY
uniref:MtN3 and saliva related transmembrane protein n=1 Tax=viral metagenome TaxID=1070528 RepID=A0A6C0AZ28_9ZZZZ